MMDWHIETADVMDWAARYDGPKFHALLCDPPYHLGPNGFMGKSWDAAKYGIAFKPDTWAALAEHLLPGAFGMAFASSRGWHRLAVAIEDAGLRIHPSIFGWSAGSGFPKSTKVERASLNDNSPFCQCVNSPQQSQQHGFQCNVPGGMDTSTSSQDDCFQGCCLSDERLRHDQGNGQDVEPLQGGVQEHNHSGGSLAEIHGGNEPSHNLSSVQCTVHPSMPDCQALDDAVLQSPLVRGDGTCLAGDSIHASMDDNEVQDQIPICEDGDTKAHHIQRTCSSVSALPYQPPVVGIRSHDTTKGQHCQICGKVKRGIWQGHRYGLQAMKPALEPIIVFQKPYAGKPVDSITATGAGALNIEQSRIGTDTSRGDRYNGKAPGGAQASVCQGKWDEPWQVPQGRWPANFCLTHAPGCVRVGEKRVRGTGIAIKHNKSDDQFERNEIYGKYHQLPSDNVTYAAPDGLETIAAWDCVPECPVRRLGEQSGERASCGEYTKSLSKPEILNYGLMFANPDISSTRKEKNRYSGDKGTAARFFHQSDWSYEIAERLAQADPVRYVAKASRKERDAGLERFPVQELQTHGEMRPDTTGKSHNTTGQRSARARNFHPTIKPIALTRWLATLLLPPAEYAPRRLMVPFAGTGSEMIGGGGWEYILGIEMDADTVDIASARLEHWLEQSRQLELIR